MTSQRIAELRARIAKPTPEPFLSIITELLDAVDSKPDGGLFKAKAGRKPLTETDSE